MDSQFLFSYLALGAHEGTHVLDDADEGQPHTLTERDFLPHVHQRHFLV